MIFVMGPVAGYVCNQFSTSTSAMIGSLLCAFGLLCTSFARHIPVMYFTYGVILGTGSSLSYNAAYLTVPRFFKRWRSVSMGILAAGAQVGNLCLSPLVAFLLETLGWIRTYQISAALVLIILPLGLAFRNIFAVDVSKESVPAETNPIEDCASTNGRLGNNIAGAYESVVECKAHSQIPLNIEGDDRAGEGEGRPDIEEGKCKDGKNEQGSKMLVDHSTVQDPFNYKRTFNITDTASTHTANSESERLPSIALADDRSILSSKEQKRSCGLDFSVWKNGNFTLFAFASTISMFGFYVTEVYLVSEAFLYMTMLVNQDMTMLDQQDMIMLVHLHTTMLVHLHMTMVVQQHMTMLVQQHDNVGPATYDNVGPAT